jgi:hypothetical protein
MDGLQKAHMIVFDIPMSLSHSLSCAKTNFQEGRDDDENHDLHG